MRLIAWSYADHCKKVIIWTTRFYSRSSKGVLGRSKKEGAQNRRQDCAELRWERCQQTPSSLERQRLERQFWWWVIHGHASVMPEVTVGCVCSAWLQTCCLNGWMGSSLPGFHTPSLFPNGSSTLWHRDMATGFFLLTTPVMQLEAPPHCKQMNWAPPGLPKCTAQLCLLVCPKPATSLIQFFGTLHPDFPSLSSHWDDFTPGDRTADLAILICP